MAAIKANFTPVPAGYDSRGQCKLLVYISLVGKGDNGVPIKISFDDYHLVKAFADSGMAKNLQLHKVVGGNQAKLNVTIADPQPDPAYWKFFDFQSEGKLINFFFDDKQRVETTLINVQLKREMLAKKRGALDRKIKQALKKIEVLQTNFIVFSQLITDLNTHRQDIQGYDARIREYTDEQGQITADIASRQKTIASDKRDRDKTAYYLQLALHAEDVLKDYQNNKFIPGNKEDVISYIKNNLPGAGNAPTPTVGPTYTYDVSDDQDSFYLSDALGYFSSFDEFQSKLGLVQTISINPTDLDETGLLQLSCESTTADIEYSFPLVHYDRTGNNYFYPLARDGSKYKRMYLKLLPDDMNGKPGKPIYDLLQNSFEETKHRAKNNGQDGVKHGDYTNGFFLVQDDPSNDLNETSSDFSELYLDDLVMGYRVDMRRGSFSWKSMHWRTHFFKINNVATEELTDEGFISANSVTKGFEVVTVRYQGSTQNVELNINQLTTGDHTLEIYLDDTVNNMKLGLAIGPDKANEFSVNEDATTVSIKLALNKPDGVLSGKPLEEFVNAVNNFLTQQKAAFSHRWIQMDKIGRIYYGGLLNSDGTYNPKAIPSYVPSSLLCHINSYSLSAPKYTGPKLTAWHSYTDNPAPKKGIESFMQQNHIRQSIKVPFNKSLFLLRIGDFYSIRCRLTLIGGVSLPPDDLDVSCAIKDIKFLRQDPIMAPKLLFPSAYESDKWLRDLGDKDFQIILRKSSHPAGTKPRYSLISERYIAPPSISWQLAEWLKMMDIKDRPEVKILNAASENKMLQFEPSSESGPIPNVQVLKSIPGKGKFEEFVDDGVETPYIVDSMAAGFIILPSKIYSVNGIVAGLVFTDKDDVARKVDKAYEAYRHNLWQQCQAAFIANKKAVCRFWDDLVPEERKADASLKLWTLQVKASDTNKTTINTFTHSRLVVIALAEGDDIEFTIRSFSDDPGQVANLFYADTDVKRAAMLTGENPEGNVLLITDKKFRVIYALQHPAEPHLNFTSKKDPYTQQVFDVHRDPRFPQDVIIRQGLLFRGRTCREEYLMADWEEIIDDIRDEDIEGNNGSPLRIIRHYKKVFSYNEDGFYSYNDTKNIKEFEFGDAKTPSPLVFFHPPDPADLRNQPDRKYFDLIGDELHFRHELGSTKFHSVRYEIGGTSRFNEYYSENRVRPDPESPTTVSELFNSQRTGWLPSEEKIYEHAVRATKAPMAPKVVHMVPLFDTDISVVNETKKVFKGIRIYLARPWFSSGWGEGLAVIIKLSDGEHQNPDFEPYLTQFGRDLATKEDNPTLGMERYFKQKDIEKAFLLPILNTAHQPEVVIARYPVTFDKGSKLWFADVIFEDAVFDESYCPFVRLSISRFQKFAVPSQELSEPVTCDFAQIYPERTLTITNVNKIRIAAPNIKRGGDGKPLSRIHYWRVPKTTAMIEASDRHKGFLFDSPNLLDEPEPVDNINGEFTIPFDETHRAVIIREYEYFSNTSEDKKDLTGKRLLYSHVIKLKP